MRKLFTKTWTKTWIIPIIAVFFLFQIICLPTTASAKWEDRSDELDFGNGGSSAGLAIAAAVVVVVAVVAVIFYNKKKSKTAKNEVSSSANAKSFKKGQANDLKSNNSQIGHVDTKGKKPMRIFDAKRIEVTAKGLAFNF